VSFVRAPGGGLKVVARIRGGPAIVGKPARPGMAPEIDAILRRRVALPVDSTPPPEPKQNTNFSLDSRLAMIKLHRI
jgi:hypothetical protein